MKKSDETFENDVKASFDASVDALDAATLSKLNRGRHVALAELTRSRVRWSRWIPAAGVAATALLAFMLLQNPGEPGVVAGTVSVTDMEILFGEDSIEMLEDLEFYSWIDVAETDGDVG